jgi:cytochrome oxidase assembly protein ShyY1
MLRQPRYATIAALMLVVALICVAAGTWQISRFEQSVHDNRALKHNAYAPAVPLTSTVVPLAGSGPAPGRDAIRYRTVTVTGTYIAGRQYFVRLQSDDGTSEFNVLNPVRTSSGVLLVVRGSISNHSRTTPPATVTPPPAGVVHLEGRLQTASSSDDDAARLTRGELESINPTQQARRSGAPVYNAYMALTAHQPGTAGLTLYPRPDLSNPAGGAYEAQHFAYIVQWYLFALLALAAPFAIARHEMQEARRRFLGLHPANEEIDSLPPAARRELSAGAAGTGRVALRSGGTLVAGHEVSRQRWQRASRLASRYGLSLGVDPADIGADDGSPAPGPGQRTRRAGGVGLGPQPANSAATPHRSQDGYHGSYNDYLWQLALADGAVPDPAGTEPPGTERPVPDPAGTEPAGTEPAGTDELPAPAIRTIDPDDAPNPG